MITYRFDLSGTVTDALKVDPDYCLRGKIRKHFTPNQHESCPGFQHSGCRLDCLKKEGRLPLINVFKKPA